MEKSRLLKTMGSEKKPGADLKKKKKNWAKLFSSERGRIRLGPEPNLSLSNHVVRYLDQGNSIFKEDRKKILKNPKAWLGNQEGHVFWLPRHLGRRRAGP